MYLNLRFAFVICLSYCSLAWGQITYTEMGPAFGINHKYGPGTFGGGVSFYDFNGDGWDDLTFSSGVGKNVEFYQNTGGNYTKVNPPFITLIEDTKSVMWVDFDNDGDQDLFTCSKSSGVNLYSNDGSMNFTDITATAGLPTSFMPTWGACFGDYDNDGWLDLYITNYTNNYQISNHENMLFHNDGNGTFSDSTAVAGVADGGKAPFGASFVDIDNDGDVDLYIYTDRKLGNTLFENNGDGTFTDISVASGADVALDAMCIGIGDYDGNDYMDFYITNTPGGNSLLKNNGNNTFTDDAIPSNTIMYGVGWGSVFYDYDCDLDLDLYLCAMRSVPVQPPNILYQNDGTGVFSSPGNLTMLGDTLDSAGAAIGDINNDGYPDLAVNKYNSDSSAIWQMSGNTKNWLKIGLQGVNCNRDAYGARIEVFTPGKKQIRGKYCGVGYLSQNGHYNFIGLDNLTQADSVIIKWPGGNVDKLINVAANQTLDIVETVPIFGVELNEFSGKQVDNQIVLNWSTASESQSDRVIIERMNLQQDFVAIGNQKALGKAGAYQFFDSKPMNGMNIYRLQFLDLDGSVEYSALVEVEFVYQIKPVLFPQPVEETLHVQIEGMQGQALLRIYDLNGRMIRQWTWAHNDLHTERLDFAGLTPGMYVYHLTVGGKSWYNKLLKD